MFFVLDLDGSLPSVLTVLFANIDYDVSQGDCVTIFAVMPMFSESYVPVCGVFHGSKALQAQMRA